MGKRTQRFSTELYASLDPFVYEYRRTSLVKRSMTRQETDNIKLKYLHVQQQTTTAPSALGDFQHQPYPMSTSSPEYYRQLDQLGMDAAICDEKLNHQIQETNLIGEILQKEVYRITVERQHDWKESIKILVGSFKENYNEKVAIWENVKLSMENLEPKW